MSKNQHKSTGSREKLYIFFGIFLSILILVFFLSHLAILLSYRPTEVFPKDEYLTNVKVKKALVAVAHDDEMATFSGTLAILESEGWEIDFLCFYQGDKSYEIDKMREAEAENATKILNFSKSNFIYKDMVDPTFTTNRKRYEALPYDSFSHQFYVDSVRNTLLEIVKLSNPTVIFTLDDSIGGYGHPEHVLIGQLAKSIAKELAENGNYNIERIYQCVYPDSFEKKLMDGGELYEEAKKIYGVDGMPNPEVEIDISNYGEIKMKVLNAFASQKRDLKKFVPYYHVFPGWFYYRIFDKEYFKVINVTN
jgi:LmbE family N-acetylglucosaminyl deacetylase